MARPVDSQCQAFQLAVEVLGRQWNALLLNVLMGGPLRFSELAERARGPGDKVLSARLKELEGRGLIVRRVEAGPPVRVAYQLTDTGRGFGRVAEAIERWGRELAAGGVNATGAPAADRPGSRRAPPRASRRSPSASTGRAAR